MKYWNLIKSDKHPATTTEAEPVVQPQVVESNEDNEEVIQKLSNIEEILLEMKKHETKPMPKTTMNNDQITDIISYMLGIRKKYIPDIFLTDSVPEEFIWNIPQCVYKTYQDMVTYDEEDIMNPLFWFTIFCVDLDPVSMCKILKRAFDSITPKTYERINAIIAEAEGADDDVDEMEEDPDLPPDTEYTDVPDLHEPPEDALDNI